jgi:hypothetical protein
MNLLTPVSGNYDKWERGGSALRGFGSALEAQVAAGILVAD